MKRLLAGIAALGILASVSACVVHDTAPPPAAGYHQQRDIAARIKDQQTRIDQGVRSRELTYHEADIVQGNLNHIRNEYKRMRTDGRLNQREYERLDALLDQNGSMIYRERHNNVRRLY